MASKTTGKLNLWLTKMTDKISDTISTYLYENFTKIDTEFSAHLADMTTQLANKLDKALTSFENRHKEHLYTSNEFNITINASSTVNQRALIELTIISQGQYAGVSGGGISKYIIDVHTDYRGSNIVTSITKVYGEDRVIYATPENRKIYITIENSDSNNKFLINAKVLNISNAGIIL